MAAEALNWLASWITAYTYGVGTAPSVWVVNVAEMSINQAMNLGLALAAEAVSGRRPRLSGAGATVQTQLVRGSGDGRHLRLPHATVMFDTYATAPCPETGS